MPGLALHIITQKYFAGVYAISIAPPNCRPTGQ
jgi:hypothetical protein